MKMEYYVKEIPGLKHPMEDSSYAKVFINSEGQEIGLFMVADGLTQHGGTKASHNAIYTIASYLEGSLHPAGDSNDDIKVKDHIQQAIFNADKNLKSFGSTF